MKLKLQSPVVPLRINQPFGTDPKTYAQFGLAGHNGLDMWTYHGQPIYAAHDGIANYEVDSSQGHGVDLISTTKFDNGYSKTRYWHLCDPKKEPQFASPIYRKKNVKVKTGDLIGYADNTGFSTGDHLHFGYKPQGKNSKGYYNLHQNNGFLGAVDPMPFIEVPNERFEPGVTSQRVRVLQAILKDTGYFPAKQEVTGFWGSITTASYDKFKAATQFQLIPIKASTNGKAGIGFEGMKPLIQSKTFWVNALTFAVGAVALFNESFSASLTPEMAAVGVSILGVLNIALRFFTTKEITSVV